jgi:hypothetical protein
MFVSRKLADVFPILLADIGIDFDSSGIEAISAAFFTAGDPILLACFPVEIVGLEARAGKRVEPAALVVKICRTWRM